MENEKRDYSNGHCEQLQHEVKSIREQYRRDTLSESEKHRCADRLHQLCGSLRTAAILVPLVQAEHRNSVQWGLERVMSTTITLGALACVDQQKQESVQGKIDGILHLLDDGKLDTAERAVRDLETEVAAIRMEALDRRVEDLLAGIDVAYQLN